MKRITLILNGIDLGNGLGLEANPKEETAKELPSKDVVIESSMTTDALEFTSETPDKKPKTVEVPMDLLTGLMELAKNGKGGKTDKDDDDKFTKAIQSLADSLNSKVNPEDRFTGIKPIDFESIDPEDFLEVPEMFFAHSVSYTLWDDKKFGQTIRAPYERPIKFKILYRTVDKSIPRQPKFYNVCVALIQSKKVRDFLLKHSLFNIKFFRTQKEGDDISATLAEKLAMAFNVVNQLTEQEIVAACTRENITINTTDASELRRRLAMQRARRAESADSLALKKKAASQKELYMGVKDMSIANNENLEYIKDNSSQASSFSTQEENKGPLDNPF